MFTIRYGRREDANRLLEIENAVFPGDRLSFRSLVSAAASPSLSLIIAEWRGEIMGYGIVSYRRGSRNARLFSIAVDPASPRGLGRFLLEKCETDARNRECLRLRLEVRADNARAVVFYEKNNYRLFGQRDDYYDDGATALRYEKMLAFSANATFGALTR